MFALLKMGRPLFPGQIPIEVLGFGSGMLVIIVLIHGAGLNPIVARYKRRSETLRERSWNPHLATPVFAGTILLLLFLHVFEIGVWGVVLKGAGLIVNFRDALYFSANTYTTIGYGEMLLPFDWRELSPLMAISGLFTFAWTTGEMFNIVQSHHKLVEELTAARDKKKAELKQVALAQVAKLQEILPLDAQTKPPGASLTGEQRHSLREEIAAKLAQLHAAERADLDAVRHDKS